MCSNVFFVSLRQNYVSMLSITFFIYTLNFFFCLYCSFFLFQTTYINFIIRITTIIIIKFWTA